MTTTTSTPPAIVCPGWCTTDHAVDRQYVDRGLCEPTHVWHYGPHFGKHIQVGVFAEQPTAMLDDLRTDDGTAEELRQLAADALAAAEWLEAQA